ncbi:TA system VapC family ribonuclease toxin [Euzebya tangerina]|uniref:TA system VapC family ribonuclease toxin n=1 Tax=Euzebya tangerina TaxID=591198 RepID=UPI000E30DA33|nr:TA system VapC family ribonuclease toxin [Euzebya tangerina]
MIVDANVLLYARNADDPSHDRARRWLESALNGEARVGLPWLSLSAFYRIATNPRALQHPLSPASAADQIRAWRSAPRAWTPSAGAGFDEVFLDVLTKHEVRGPLTTDALLAALARHHGVAVVSTDADFARFDVQWINPLA